MSRLRASWGGTLGQNLVVGGMQTFLRTGSPGEEKNLVVSAASAEPLGRTDMDLL